MDPKNGVEVKWPTDEQMLHPNWTLFLRLAVYVFLAVGPYSLLIDICDTYNHNLISLSKRRQRNRNSERIKVTWCVCWLTKEETITLMNFLLLFRALKEHEAPSIVRDSTYLAVLVWHNRHFCAEQTKFYYQQYWYKHIRSSQHPDITLSDIRNLTGRMVRDRIPVGTWISTHPDWPWGPHSLL